MQIENDELKGRVGLVEHRGKLGNVCYSVTERFFKSFFAYGYRDFENN